MGIGRMSIARFSTIHRGSSRKVMEKSGRGIGGFLSREISKTRRTIMVTSGKKSEACLCSLALLVKFKVGRKGTICKILLVLSERKIIR